MDVIADLARKAAANSSSMSKEAGLGLGKMLGGLADDAGRWGGKQLWRSVSRPLSTGGFRRKFSPGRALGTAAVAAPAAMAAKDFLPGTGGSWKGQGNIGWHRQRATGQAGMGNMAQAWAARPGKSLYSLFSSQQGPTSVQGGWESAGEKTIDPETGKEIQQFQRSKIYSPADQYKLEQYQALKKRHDAARAAQEAKVTAAQKALESGNYGGGWFGGSVAERQAAHKTKLDQLQQQLASGEYGGGWGSNNAAAMQAELDAQREYLRSIGLLRSQAPQPMQRAQFPGIATRPLGDPSFRRYSLASLR